ncbi:hypothetical protein M409DRAFT_23883 [Zasmidium cellare ATCC 36951]|uniref:BTB domain-containing protein n=1 Tax=Zasmidium cellare ATCC 36951 TaxID=1080233 RepID=A0A6A6CHE0_ZASCE|nr:uncharacterized protein M409DRAFT_23883 [Zasmidium cellare ATCC 36951]KAF2165590.1 hypothetical protein M409DRAFT_23883 [Zasmidium cellare ATCC 36951]
MPARKRPAREMEVDSRAAVGSGGVDHISKNGDVVFYFPGTPTNGNNKITKIRVSSAILTMTSPVFATLLGPHFREGQEPRNPSSPLEIPLPEDDLQTMSDLCLLLHHICVPEFALASDLDRVVAFAVAADKWDCTEALTLQSRGILLQALYHNVVSDDGVGLAKLATIAYCLNEEQIFADVVDTLMLNYAGSFLEVKNELEESILPVQFYLVLEERRSKAREKLSVGLRELSSFCKRCKTTMAKGAVDSEYLRHIAMDDPESDWPPAWQEKSITLDKAFNHIRSLKPIAFRPMVACKDCGSRIPTTVHRADFEALCRRTARLWEGLSLACIGEDCLLFKEDSLRCAYEGEDAE